MKFVVSFLVFLMFLIICLQNYQATQVQILLWNTPPVPLIVILLLSFLVGLIAGWVTPKFRSKKA